MANEKRGSVLDILSRNIVAVATVFVVLMLFIPFSKIFIDILMTLNLTFAVIILLTVVKTPRASQFSSFPQIVLFVTLFGTGINVSSTRLILSAQGTNPAFLARTQSSMVQAVANIVAGNSLIIGFVVFVMIIVFQIVVVTKGAGRVSEVAARFTLDSMSTKFFDIDNQLNSGYINEEEARLMKEDLRRDIDFYSNMDGSSKFVSGNVKVGIIITIANLVGGFAVGMLVNKLSASESMSVYTKLTIGDGLLSQIPSLILSVATGLLVTADKSEETFGEQVVKNFSIDGSIYQVVGGFIAALALVFHNETFFFLVPIAGLIFYYGYSLSKKKVVEEAKKMADAAQQKVETTKAGQTPESESVAPLDPLSLELGYGLISLVDKEKGAELLERISRIRKESALDIGLPVPKIHIIDNMNLDPNEYSFKIRGIEVGRSTIRIGYYMCMDTGAVTEQLKGEATRDPAFGMPAIWVPESERSDAEAAGYAVVDPPTIIATHLTETIRANAAEILGRQEVSLLVNEVKKTNPIVVDEVLSGDNSKFTYGEIEKVLKGLLEEQVSIRDMVTILETLANYGPITHNRTDLIEKVRQELGMQICLQYVDGDKKLRVMNLSQGWLQKIHDHTDFPADGSKPLVAFDPVDGRAWIRSVSDALQKMQNIGHMPIILCSHIVRPAVKASIEHEMPGVVVISDKEILRAGRNIQLEVLGEITEPEGMSY